MVKAYFVTLSLFLFSFMLSMVFLTEIRHDIDDRYIAFKVENKLQGLEYHKHYASDKYTMVVRCVDTNERNIVNKKFYFNVDPVTYTDFNIGDNIRFKTSPNNLKPSYDDTKALPMMVNILLMILDVSAFILFLSLFISSCICGFSIYDFTLVIDFILFVIWLVLI